MNLKIDWIFTHHVKGAEKEKEIVKGFTNFLFQQQDDGEDISHQTEAASNEHDDSLHQEGEHRVPVTSHLQPSLDWYSLLEKSLQISSC